MILWLSYFPTPTLVEKYDAHHLRDAHLGPLAVEPRLAGRAQPAGRTLAQVRILVAP